MKYYNFTIEGFKDFSNDNKIPLIYEDLTDYENLGQPHFELLFFEKDRKLVEDFIYWTKPMVIQSDLISVPNQIEYNQEKLLEYKEPKK